MILQISLDFDNRFRVRGKIFQQKKNLLANLEEAAQNPKEKNRVKPLFRSLIWEHPDYLISRTALENVIKNIFQNTKPCQVSGTSRLHWHINKSLKNKT